MRMPLVLLIDDVAPVRAVFAGLLRNAGFEVDEAEDGAAGMRRLRARMPDVVVCDLEMPHMDGVTFCRSVRADPGIEALPIVVVSGADGMMAAAAVVAGCNAIVAKPCSGAVLVATVRRLLVSAPPAPRSAAAEVQAHAVERFIGPACS
jgi:two-component system, OmpR family, response regulator